ncbi:MULTISPECIES: phosphatase PAP2 family protein [Lysinibacillus]|uniref:Phosphatase PAP2 family protein n=1 Tax=Lysinibacillus antri TaxID=2498145 RepID=A0A432LCI1_9BACI|nr:MULTISPECIES: phosphatase PAP2 family protein [Lysinibacillus]RUL53625.1 phosphatase PAP2 family protein [Lysinibacillus antri]TSI06444.1 phosphatase PAP2 family protein [Lysinibacillus sp. BW-2-10]
MKKLTSILAIITLFTFFIVLMNYEKSFFVNFDEQMKELFFGNSIIVAFHYIGNTPVIIAVALILLLVLWLKQRNYRGMLFVLLTIAGGRVLNQIIKNAVDRPRPEMLDQLTSFSFPSGHAMLSLLYLFTIAYLLSETLASNKKIVLVWFTAIILAFFIGLSRIAENRHFATDVLAGWAIAYTWFAICVFWYEQRKRKFNKIKSSTL